MTTADAVVRFSIQVRTTQSANIWQAVDDASPVNTLFSVGSKGAFVMGPPDSGLLRGHRSSQRPSPNASARSG